MYQCEKCQFSSESIHKFLKHLRRHENADPYILIKCHVCQKQIVGSQSWARHVKRHKGQGSNTCEDDTFEETVDRPVQQNTGGADQDHGTDGQAHSSAEQYEGASSCSGVKQPTVCSDSEPNAAVHLLMKLRARNVPEKVCAEVAEGMKTFAAEVVRECSDSIAASCHQQHENVEPKSLPSVSQLYEVDTAAKFESYTRKRFNMVPPQTIVLGKSMNGRVESFQYVPLSKQLEALCDKDAFQKQCTFPTSCAGTTRSNHDNQFEDIWDGSHHKRDMEDKTLGLILYYDEFVVTCPIGNKTKKYKIGGVYYTIANISRRSRLDNVHLALLFHEYLVEKYTMETILGPLIADLLTLETEGIRVTWKGESLMMRGRVELLVGDNLALHQLAGYFCSFQGTRRVCRMCHATSEDLRTKFEESDFTLRTSTEYDAEIRVLEEENYDPEMCKVFAIRNKCCLSELPSFHPIERISVDVTHDLFEGVVQYVVSEVLTCLR